MVILKDELCIVLSFIFFLNCGNKVWCSDCYFIVGITLNLLNEGFHRNLTYDLQMDGIKSKEWLNGDCSVAINQTLPPGIYVNPDELDDLNRIRKIDVVPMNPVNVELPTEQSSESQTFIFGKVQSTHTTLWIPVHARYHRAVAGGKTASNTISPPKLYLRCGNVKLLTCNVSNKPVRLMCNGTARIPCEWKETSHTDVSNPIIWEVPVGDMDHYYLVSSLTAIVIMMGSIQLLKEIHNVRMRLIKKNT